MPDTDPLMEAFVRASLAQWTGDPEVVRKQANEVLRLARQVTELEDAESLEDLLGYRAGQMVLSLPKEIPGTLPLGTEHITGILVMRNRREFELRAYLRDFSWRERFVSKAHSVAGRYEALWDLTDHPDRRSASSMGREGDGLGQAKLGIGAGEAWVKTTNEMIFEVIVDPLGLLQIVGKWHSDRVPRTVESVAPSFLAILNEVEDG